MQYQDVAQFSNECPYCGNPVKLVAGVAIYGTISHEVDRKKFWRCDDCAAHVGCHGGTETPLGTLANHELRVARMRAHEAFDPLWRYLGPFKRRAHAYRWLAKRLKIREEDCHIGRFNLEQCAAVVRVSADRASALAWARGKDTR